MCSRNTSSGGVGCKKCPSCGLYNMLGNIGSRVVVMNMPPVSVSPAA